MRTTAVVSNEKLRVQGIVRGSSVILNMSNGRLGHHSISMSSSKPSVDTTDDCQTKQKPEECTDFDHQFVC